MLGSFVTGIALLLGLALLDRSPAHSVKTEFLT